jgi:hypothetical protein
MSELVIDTEGDDKHWIQLTEDVRQRPLLFDCTNGAWANLLSIRPGGRLKCHYHTGPVHAFVLNGSWRYLEHDWVAGEVPSSMSRRANSTLWRPIRRPA